jgi:hypothetical protein
MPNRIIKDSIRTSETVASLTDFEFRLWIELIVSVDDAGRGDARPAIIKGSCFPLRDRVTARDIGAALHGLAAKGCVSLYEVDGKPYFWFPSWAEHQRIRDCKPKYPEPPAVDERREASAAICGELRQSAASCGELRLDARAPAESESESNTNPNPNTSDKRTRFVPPTLEEVEEYVRSRNSPVDPRKFWDYFDAGHWRDSNGKPVKSWKQKVLTWEKYDKGKENPQWDSSRWTAPEDDMADLRALHRRLREAEDDGSDSD